VLFEVQRPKTAGLHVKEASENLAKIIRILVAAGDSDFVDVHRCEKQQVFRVFHPGAMDPFSGIASVGLAVNATKVVRVPMEFSRDQ
jgi:hypothetical protein